MGTAATVQLALVGVFTHAGVDGFLANATAFLLAAQVNFALSAAFTWRERLTSGGLPRRWVVFHCSISAMAAVNMSVFLLVRQDATPIVASAAGILAGSVGNYVLGDRLVFRAPRRTAAGAGERRLAA